MGDIETASTSAWKGADEFREDWEANLAINHIADTLFFSTSSGFTENSEDVFSSKVPYLKSVKSDWDKISPVFRETSTYNINDFYKMLHIDCDNKVTFEVLSKTKGGRINRIKISNKVFTGKDIVKIFI